MKLLLIPVSLMLAAAVSGFYDISFETLDGNIIKTSSYQGKKVVIAVVSAGSESLPLVRYLDSLQRTTDSIKIIAVPTGDFGGSVTLSDMKELKKNLSIVVAKPVSVKRGSAAQHPLFTWLTDVKLNTHFDMDVSGEGQVFIISTKGTLYSVLPKGTPTRIITRAISQPFTR